MANIQEEAVSILSLDAGGPGVFSQLNILREYMWRLGVDLGMDGDEILPCDHFDFISGVGTGGLAAIMLGCLRMSVQEVQDEFMALGRNLFSPSKASRRDTSAPYDSGVLKEQMERLLYNRQLEMDLQMANSRPMNSKARVAVGAVNRHGGLLEFLRSYPSRQAPSKGSLIEVACATMAIPGLFKPFKIGEYLYTHEYIGPGITFGNPTDPILKEVRDFFRGQCQISVILSIGTGDQGPLMPEALTMALDQYNVLRRIAFHSDMAANTLASQLNDIEGYLRLNVIHGMKSVSLDDWTEPGALEAHAAVYLEGPEISQEIDRSIELLKNSQATATVEQLSRTAAIFSAAKSVPSVSPFFVPRKDAFNQMVKCLISDQPRQRKVFVLYGMGGCGKTQLVAYFVKEHVERYEQVLFIDASTKSSIRVDLQAAIRAIGVEHRRKTSDEGLVMLASDHRYKKWLIIYDNADDASIKIASYFPQSTTHGTIVVTTRNIGHCSLAKKDYHWELGPMSKAEACETLRKAARRPLPIANRNSDGASEEPTSGVVTEYNDGAADLAEILGYLAVALVQAASYCFLMSSKDEDGTPQVFAFTSYLKLLEPSRKMLMEQAASSQLDRYDKGVYATLDISYPKLSEPAKDLLRISSFFHRSNIPLVVLSAAAQGSFCDLHKYLNRPDDHIGIIQGLRNLFSPDGQWSEAHINSAVQNLRAYSLVTTIIGDSTVSLRFHRLVHAWARDFQSESEMKRFFRMGSIILSSCAGHNLHYRKMLPHVMEMVKVKGERATSLSLHVNDKAAFATIFMGTGGYSEAEKLWRDVRASVMGRGDEMVLEAEAQLAEAYFKQGMWSKAETLQKQILDRRRKDFDPADDKSLEMMGRLADTYAKQAKWDDAEATMEDLVDVAQKSKGADNDLTIDASAKLAILYEEQGKYDSALQKERELIQILREKFPPGYWKISTAEGRVGKIEEMLGQSL